MGSCTYFISLFNVQFILIEKKIIHIFIRNGQVNPFPTLKAPSPLSNLFIAFEANLLTNLDKLFLDKGIARCYYFFYLNYLIYYEEIHMIK